MIAARQIDYTSIFGSYVMKTQFEIVKETNKTDRFNTNDKIVLQETVEDYIEQA